MPPLAQMPRFSICRASVGAGLKKYTFDDALEYLLTSEENQPQPPQQYCVTNRSMIGRIYLQQGDRQKALEWLTSAMDADVRPELMDPTAVEARQAATKALKSC